MSKKLMKLANKTIRMANKDQDVVIGNEDGDHFVVSRFGTINDLTYYELRYVKMAYTELLVRDTVDNFKKYLVDNILCSEKHQL